MHDLCSRDSNGSGEAIVLTFILKRLKGLGLRLDPSVPLWSPNPGPVLFVASGGSARGGHLLSTLNSVRRLRWCSSSVHFAHLHASLGLLSP